MLWDPDHRPKLRALEPFSIPPQNDESGLIGLRDPSGVSDLVLSLSPAALHILALMDGDHTCAQIRERFEQSFGAQVSVETLADMLQHLEDAHFLDGPHFESHYATLLSTYRERGVRTMPHAAMLGVNRSGETFREILDDLPGDLAPRPVRGIIAPHLDYPRGRPCYAAAYGVLRQRPAPRRVIVLGTNHYGRSSGIVGTGNHFETPLGVTRTDVDFLQRLEARCGPLTTYELDHAREHSVELQVAWLQYLFGADAFETVAFLCPDPCGRTGTAPYDGHGVDLRHFADELGKLIAEDGQDTLLVAGADLSHIGATFGDERILDELFLTETMQQDRIALDLLCSGSAERFRGAIAEAGNPTRVCSVGCMYTLAAALPQARATQLAYHQAVDHESQTCVTCTAMAFE